MRAKVALWLLWLAFFVSVRLCCCGGQLEGKGGEMAREGLKMGNLGVWRATERCRTGVLGCISPPMGRVVGVWLGAALRWRRMAFNRRLNSV